MKNNTKKRLLTLITVVILVLAVAPGIMAGGKSEKKEEITEIAGYSLAELGVTQDEVLAQVEKKELVIVIPASYAPSKPFLDSLMPLFNEQTGETYRIEALPENEMYDKIQMEMSARSGRYDILYTGANGAKRYGIGGFLITIPPPDDVDDILAADLDQYSFRGKIYGMPVDTNINLLYYRTDLLEEAGFVDAKGNAKPPETWEEFREMAIELTVDRNGKNPNDPGFDKNNVVQWGTNYKAKQGLPNVYEWYNFMFAKGGRLMDENFRPTVNSRPNVEALQFYVDNVLKYSIVSEACINYDYPEFGAEWLKGNVAMCINWPFMAPLSFDPDNSEIVGKWSVAMTPVFEDVGKHAGPLGGESWNILKTSQNIAGALQFVEKYSTAEYQKQIYNAIGWTPVRHSTWKQIIAEATDPIKKKVLEMTFESLKSGITLRTYVVGDAWGELDEYIEIAVQKALIGDLSPQAALDEAQEGIEDLLERIDFYDKIK